MVLHGAAVCCFITSSCHNLPKSKRWTWCCYTRRLQEVQRFSRTQLEQQFKGLQILSVFIQLQKLDPINLTCNLKSILNFGDLQHLQIRMICKDISTQPHGCGPASALQYQPKEPELGFLRMFPVVSRCFQNKFRCVSMLPLGDFNPCLTCVEIMNDPEDPSAWSAIAEASKTPADQLTWTAICQVTPRKSHDAFFQCRLTFCPMLFIKTREQASPKRC